MIGFEITILLVHIKKIVCASKHVLIIMYGNSKHLILGSDIYLLGVESITFDLYFIPWRMTFFIRYKENKRTQG